MAHNNHYQSPTILLFGPQSSISTVETLRTLLSTLQSQPTHWAVAAFAELPASWDAWTDRIPTLHAVPGKKLLTDLYKRLTNGFEAAEEEEAQYLDLPNTLLVPLVVLTQLLQFETYIRQQHDCIDSVLEELRRRKVRALGFCTGLLCAYVVGTSFTREDFERYGAVAIRLATLIGAAVDAFDTENGRAISFAVKWQTPEQGEQLKCILAEFQDDAYASVLYDERKTTVTASEKAISALLDRLHAAGIKAPELGLHGRFHTAVHQRVLHELAQFCDEDAALQLPDASCLLIEAYANIDGEPLSNGPLHSHALRAILVQQANWHGTFGAVCRGAGSNVNVVSFSSERCVPPSLRGLVASQQVVDGLDVTVSWPPSTVPSPAPYNDNEVAIVGLSIKVAGADDVDEFSALLRSGLSQHTEVDTSRVPFGASSTPWRLDSPREKHKWFGNFVSDVDAFDHRFFNKSPRESAAMDPQQRLFLQAAYQAAESAGWFSRSISELGHDKDAHVGVYVGTCSTDYENYVACHPAGAFSATGLLRSFIAGKVSHYFGWTGPAMTFDTACSGSAVAIHTACKALLSGECTAALCGGVNLMGSPLWFQNLAGASFLSPTGQCKPFDELADGYCRGEGIGCVFLRPMKAALADGDRILGCISSTAVYQNDNSTPVFVPNAPSLSRLFVDVVRKAGLRPQDISLVEAHGTGTPVGDPAEYQSIRQALAGPNRTKPLPIGSVKGLIGHTESTSGVASLIKVLVLMHESFIPPQPSYSKLSHHINSSSGDMIEVPTTLRQWPDEQKVALINNYGASGSNASIVVRQMQHNDASLFSIHSCARQPFWITGLSGPSIEGYCKKLIQFVERRKDQVSLADIAFNIARQSNRTFSHGISFSCNSISELTRKISSLQFEHSEIKPSRPMILCFGGQVSTFVGLDRKVYDSVKLLRKHLDECDAIMKSLGLDGIFPHIFSRSPVSNPVKLQTMLFALQYACARSWIDSGVKVEALVGHSFGEITALCVSGVLTLADTIKLIAARARLVRDAWEADPGRMMAVEGDLDSVHTLLSRANMTYQGEYPATIACYNGPRSFTLAGSSEAMAAVEKSISTVIESSRIKSKLIHVTNAFHSTLVEPLLPALEQIGLDLEFHDPVIPIERAAEERLDSYKFSPEFVAHHMRSPVFFSHAVERLAKKYPACIWLEAGSASTVTVMANRALGSSSDMHFQALNITNRGGMESLTDTTVSLWNEGVRIAFWAHHSVQTDEYKPLLLPPYQFEKTRHWLEFKPFADAILSQQRLEVASVDVAPQGLWTFTGYRDPERRLARFRVNTDSEKYRTLISGHVVVQTAPICPATVEIDMAIEALFSLISDSDHNANLRPTVRNVQNHVALCIDPAREVWLDLLGLESSWRSCTWKIVTTPINDRTASDTVCVEGCIELYSPGNASYRAEFARFERLVSHTACADVLHDTAGVADDILQGRNVYRAFSEVVNYGPYYQGVKRVVGRGNECAGMVQLHHSAETWLNVPLSDSYSQVAGLWVNCMTDRNPEDIFLATGCEIIMRSPKPAEDERPDTYHVFARHHQESDKAYMTDVFVFNPESGGLLEVLSGIQYRRIAKASLSRQLTRLTGDWSFRPKPDTTFENVHGNTAFEARSMDVIQSETAPSPMSLNHKKQSKHTRSTQERQDIRKELKRLIANICGVDASKIRDNSEMADLGIDSLMGMEISHEVENEFGCKLDQVELLDATSFGKFVDCVSWALYGAEYDPGDGNGEKDDTGSHDGSTSFSDVLGAQHTPPTTAASGSPAIHTADPDSSVIGPSPTFHEKNTLQLLPQDILSAFGEVQWSTDQRLRDAKLDDTDSTIVARSNRLCVALIVEAFEELGCSLHETSSGQVLDRIPHQPQHARLVNWLYDFLSKDARLIDIKGDTILRTGISTPRKSSAMVYQELLQTQDSWMVAHKLAYFAGKHLAEVLRGATNGVRLLFGSVEGRSLVEGLYCDLPYNRLAYEQMRDVISLLAAKNSESRGPLRILEMGAGTGGTTRLLAPFLANLGVPVEYTFTDLSLSMVAQARRRFEAYPFMHFAVHDIEKPPADELKGQHIVLASNAVHATHSLRESLGHIRKALREDGFLMLTEMTEGLPFVDLVFGLLEGWWLFDDGRPHALVSEKKWELELRAAGFGRVDWTDGDLAENKIQRVIMAMASGEAVEMRPRPRTGDDKSEFRNADIREAEAERYVTKYSADFVAAVHQSPDHGKSSHNTIVITGGTGSLGAHLVAAFASRLEVTTVVCLNRWSGSNTATTRQQEAMASRKIVLPHNIEAKVQAFEMDAGKPYLGLSKDQYTFLVSDTTHIIHNAWPMSGTRQLRAFEAQFLALRKLLDLAAAANDQTGKQITFQLISSIGVVGLHPVDGAYPEVPEISVPFTSVPRIGYCEAKWTCERILDETLRRHPLQFRTMVVRPGQIAGSRTSGYWNPVEHLAFLIKSAQSLGVFPALHGRLQWVPVDDVAATIVDLSMHDGEAFPVYHIDNPVGQPWEDMASLLARELGISESDGMMVSFRDWIRKVRRSPLSMETDNPALRLIEFLEENFERMSCGGLVLGTERAREHSATLAAMGPVPAEVARGYVRAWKEMGFLRVS